MISINDFKKKKDYLICVDSDGCAMDTMDIKHFNCFGPCLVRVWGLSEHGEDILKRWNEINLYTMTRGVNRFKGLSIMLSEVSEKYTAIEGVKKLAEWVEHSPELSNSALEAKIKEDPDSIIFRKALSWSRATNQAIAELNEGETAPFPLAKEALSAAHEIADVAIVSSANLDAVMSEWERHGLLEHTDIVLAQNSGSKAACIEALLKKGYDKKQVIMCGDAPGDLAAAEKNGVYFYPILVGREGESWSEFMSKALGRLADGSFGACYQDECRARFIENLTK